MSAHGRRSGTSPEGPLWGLPHRCIAALCGFAGVRTDPGAHGVRRGDLGADAAQARNHGAGPGIGDDQLVAVGALCLRPTLLLGGEPDAFD